MRHFRCSAFVRLVVLPFLLTVWLSACTSYVAMEPPVDRSIAKEEPNHARVTLKDGSRIVVAHPRIEADSLFGFDADSYDRRERAYTDSVHIALEEVARVEVRKFDALKTIGIPIGLFGLAMFACVSRGDSGKFGSPC